MTLVLDPSARRRRRFTTALWIGWAIIVGIAIKVLVAGFPRLQAIAASAHIHGPDLSAFDGAPGPIVFHAAAAVTALPLAAAVMLSRKGTPLHRAAGWTWAILMSVVAITPLLAITRPHYGPNFIHATIPLVLILLPRAILAARRHDITVHRASMRWLFGILIGAGVATFIPGRIMWSVFFG